jgi:hypothetical protein
MSYMGKVRPTVALTSSDITDGAVIEAKIGGDAVTLAKMEDGTQGDVLYYGASGAPTRLGFGTAGDFLKTQGTGANPIWAAAAGGGKILQVVSTTKSDTFTTTSTMVDITGLTVAITPSATTSKILVLSAVNGSQEVAVTRGYLVLYRDSTAIFVGDAAGSRSRWSGSFSSHDGSIASGTVTSCYLDSPSTTSAVTYKWQGGNGGNSGSFYINRTEDDGDDVTQIRMASTITVMEIGA